MRKVTVTVMDRKLTYIKGKRVIRWRWTCSNFVKHEHRWYLTAWLCGRWQYAKALVHDRQITEQGENEDATD